PSYSYFHRSADHRDLHSFPTRRSSDLVVARSEAGRSDDLARGGIDRLTGRADLRRVQRRGLRPLLGVPDIALTLRGLAVDRRTRDRKSTRLNSSHDQISYAVFCLKKKK